MVKVLEENAFANIAYAGGSQSSRVQGPRGGYRYHMQKCIRILAETGLIYMAANPRPLKHKNKHLLTVFWMHNAKAWITKVRTSNWFHQSFMPQVKDYLNNLGMEFKVLLVMGNAGGHCGSLLRCSPSCLWTRIIHSSLQRLVKVMDTDNEFSVKDYWHTFTTATCLSVIGQPLNAMKKDTLTACWKLWLECVHDYKGFSPEEIHHSATDKAVQLVRILGGEGFHDNAEDDVGTLTDAHSVPLTDQELEELTKSASE
ncbi:tigger transposable element-derived protein 1-like [Macrobrachium nipponense]|uniref:tigger transposable element-derived protein 1-like n=1 Tax=Macrobrachium nipponense TaxID=159736 RepID=UPI0030C83A71